jgi:hypothetical protein
VPFLLVLVAACHVVQAATPVSIQMRDGVFVVSGWSPPVQPPADGWSSIFAIYAGSGDIPPILGDYRIDSGALTFRPRYAISPGLRVRAVFRGIESFFEIPRPEITSATRVREVYPTASTLPENQLKFYIEFSGPMSHGYAWKYIRLVRSDGQPVDLPFLEIDQEMWDAGATRLTVLFDPGRIKRGVKPLEDIGPSIEQGHSYSLVIDRNWPDATGVPLTASWTKEFRVSGPDRSPVKPADWKIGFVRPGTTEPLVIRFPEPLDAALALRLIRIQGVSGHVALGAEEREWRFTPERPWTPGRYTLKVDTALEDLAGNKVGRAFDVDTFERVSRRVERESISLSFSIGR